MLNKFIEHLFVNYLLFAACLSASTCLAQGIALGLSSGAASPGGTVTLNLSLNGPSPDPPSSVQWTFGYSPADFSSATIVAGSVLSGVNKSLSCNSVAGSTTCVVWGENVTAISSGVVARVSLSVSPTTTNSSSSVQVTNGTAADGTGLALSTSSTGGTVTIIQPPGLNGFSCIPVNVAAPVVSVCSVYLTSAALNGGANIALAASSGAVSVPSSVNVPQGSSSALFLATPSAIAIATQVTVAASYLGVTDTLDLTINPSAAALSGLAANPNALAAGQSGTGTVTLSGPAGAGGVVVSLSSSNTSFAAVPSTVTVPSGANSATFPITAGNVSTAACVSLGASYGGNNLAADLIVQPQQSQSGAACFAGWDPTTQGNWNSVYGQSGYAIVGDSSAGPGTFTPDPDGLRSWASSTTDVRALQRASRNGRIADMWYSATSFLVAVGLPDQAIHQVAVYCVDWNYHGRVETISLLDANSGAVLDTQTVSNFTNGVYALWKVSGAVQLQVTRSQGNNAVITGLFLD
jgi:hypothetical protein